MNMKTILSAVMLSALVTSWVGGQIDISGKHPSPHPLTTTPTATTRDYTADLWKAIQNNNLEALKTTIAAGANVNSKIGKTGETLLDMAAYHGRFEFVKYLIEHGAEVSTKGGDWTTLMWAVESGNLDLVKYLVEVVKVDVNSKNRSGNTALSAALDRARFDKTPAKEAIIDYLRSRVTA